MLLERLESAGADICQHLFLKNDCGIKHVAAFQAVLGRMLLPECLEDVILLTD